ncbi:MAG: hypothetical protein WD096_07285 [Actinomycetota bacterium]
MSHPIELLVSLEDGTLTADERAVLDLHLQGCALCSREADMAAAARTSLRSLEVVPVPEGLLDGVRTRAERLSAAGGSTVTPIGSGARAARWQRIVSVAGAAAVVVAVVAVALPRLGGSRDDPSLAPGAELTSRASAVEVEVVQQDFDLAGVGALATSFKTGFTEDASPETSDMGSGSAPVVALAQDVEGATACLRTAFDELPGDPVRLIQARYLGTPAIFGVFLIGPGADQPATEARVLIAATADCSVLVSSQADLRE